MRGDLGAADLIFIATRHKGFSIWIFAAAHGGSFFAAVPVWNARFALRLKIKIAENMMSRLMILKFIIESFHQEFVTFA